MKTINFRDKYEYFVNESTNTVIAKLNEPYTAFNNIITKTYFVDKSPTYFIDKALIEEVFDKHPQYIHKITAKAQCSNEDVFDLETGKRIAKIRLENKIWNLWFEFFKLRQQYYWNIGVDSNGKYHQINAMIDHNTHFLDAFKEGANDED